MWERHIYECLLICGFRRWELGVRLLTVLVPIAVGFIIEISRFNQLMRYIQICEKSPRQIISKIRVIICNIRNDSIQFVFPILLKPLMVLILLWYWYTKFFSSLPSFKRICILTFLNSCTKKWNMILTPKCCTSYLFSETNINMKQRRNERLLSLSLFYSVDSTCISYLIKTSWHATETKNRRTTPIQATNIYLFLRLNTIR